MSLELNKRCCRRFYEILNSHDLSDIEGCVTDGFVNHNDNMPIRHANLSAFKRHIEHQMFQAFPDLHIQVEAMVAEEDLVCCRLTYRGTQRGAWRGDPDLPPSGKKVEIHGQVMMRMLNGKIAESWMVFDALSMFRQIGALPAFA